ncbi:macrolide efflux MFS transporter Mef(F) [Staphylococcus pseudintermedius]|uniref:macrolide efflux MFS transporter Mef(F) n=1 Tax=Staphylococcus pseudintermedius TaxID=283734 RepID=UPI0028FD6C68|nr:macrolide efflux MFS transporter Mef(F) [Staphylococcus pseudintermedius]MDU0287473.1 macrolide efflux MFS transporter Mef(F) [Staphylococcus pseudintermedius]MDU0383100.1 macrolide efflux MFS transporter Mef(F) [Staphylococcus pseudintermedius]
MDNMNWKRKFIAIFTGQFFSLLSSAAVQFSIIWWLTDTSGGSPLILTLAGLAGFMPQALLGPFAGTITDRYSRKVIMIIADMTVALGSLALFVSMYFYDPSIILVIIILIVRSLATAFHMPAMQASIPLIAPKEHLTKVSGWGQTVASISNIVGPAAGMSLLAISSVEWVLLLDVFGAVIASSILLFIHIPNVQSSETVDSSSFISDMKEGYHALVKHPVLLRLTVTITIVSVLYIPLGTYFPLMTRNHFEKGVVEAGIIEIVFAVGLIFGGILMGIFGDRFEKLKLIVSGMILMGIALFISGTLPSTLFYGFIVMAGLVGLSGPLFSAPFYALIQTEIEPHLLGRVFSFVGSLALLATPLGYAFAGVLIHLTNVAVLFLITGILIVLNAVIVRKAK